MAIKQSCHHLKASDLKTKTFKRSSSWNINLISCVLSFVDVKPIVFNFLLLFGLLQQARAEQEEEFISNTLFKKIQALQKEKETLAVNYEKEEEFLTNELSRKLMQVSDGKNIRSISIFSPFVLVENLE